MPNVYCMRHITTEQIDFFFILVPHRLEAVKYSSPLYYYNFIQFFFLFFFLLLYISYYLMYIEQKKFCKLWYYFILPLLVETLNEKHIFCRFIYMYIQVRRERYHEVCQIYCNAAQFIAIDVLRFQNKKDNLHISLYKV